MAATIVDQLLVTLDLDSAKFDAGLAKVKAQLTSLGMAVKDVDLEPVGEKGKKAGGNISSGMGRGLMAVTALVAGIYKLNSALGLPALRRLAQEVTDTETKTLRLSNYLQLNAQDLQAWQKTVQIHGGDVNGFNSGLEKMSANLGKLGTNVRGAKILQQYLGLAGVTDAMVQGKDALGVLKLYSEQMQSMSPERQVLVGKKLGLDSNMIRTLQDGGPLLAEHLKNMKELSATNAELWNAREVARAQAEANLQWTRAKEVIGGAFLPMLTKLAATLREASKWIREHQDLVKKGAVVIGAALTGLAVIAGAAALVIMAAGIKIAFGMTLATGGAWAVGAAAGVAALAALVTGIGLASTACDALKDAHSSAIDELLHGDQKLIAAKKAGDTYVQWVNEAKEALENLKKAKMETAQALGKLQERKAAGAYTAFGAAPPPPGADDAKIAELNAQAARQQARFNEITRKLGEMQTAWEASGPSAWNFDPKQAMQNVTALNAAAQKATEIKVERIDINVNTSRGEQVVTEMIDALHGRRLTTLQATGGAH